ncbi:MAG: cupin, partial [Desulfobulbaceae bacterium]|nr:cupin [Desulfobulbaceae bacterium]
VLGVYSGWVRACFGGPRGEILTAEKGDVIIIPAGLSHCNKGQSPDFMVVGGYFANQPLDMMYGKPGERPQADLNIAEVSLPTTDPIFGSDGPLLKLWT